MTQNPTFWPETCIQPSEVSNPTNPSVNMKPLVIIVLLLLLHLGQSHARTQHNTYPLSARLSFGLQPGRDTQGVTLTVAVPKSIPGRQEVKLTFSPQPASRFEKEGNAYAKYVFPELKTFQQVVIDVDARLAPAGMAAIRGGQAAPRLESASSLARWLRSETWLEAQHQQVQNVALKLKQPKDIDTVVAIQDFLNTHMRGRSFSPDEIGAAAALKKRRGDCTEFSDVFVSLCRAAGVPARTLDGYLRFIPADTPMHSAAEAYLKGYGWVRFDPYHTFLGQSDLLDPKPTLLSVDHLRNDQTLAGFHYYCCEYTSGEASVTSNWAIRN
jgi:transglutaminase-like putative cysteine protease